jgi:hypothetical protein
MKNKAILLTIILVMLMGFAAQPAKAAGETGVTIYVVPTMTNDKILPTTSISSEFMSSSISIVGCAGEYEPASFVVKANEDIQSLQVEATDLAGVTSSIPSSNIDIRVVKCWWQAGTIIKDTTHKLLTPELLLHDDSLVKVENGNNYLRMTTGEYRLISDTTLATKNFDTVANFPVADDAATLQPVSIPSGENKQFWVTVKVPDNAVSGTYTGVIQVGTIAEIDLEVEVLPIELLAPDLATSLTYQSSVAPSWEAPTIGPYQKSETQYRAELKNLLAHGVTNPSEIGGYYLDRLNTSLSIRRELGMTGQPLYALCGYVGTGTSSDPAVLEALKTKVRALVATAKSYGATDVYVYGADEADIAGLLAQRPGWIAVHEAGAKVWTASYPITGVYDAVGDLLDLVRFGQAPSAAEAAKWHSVGHQIFSYSNPQAGQEEPETYRRQYGLLLWQADYDGGMTLGYQRGFGSVWNDFDNASYRDHMMVYPTSNGVIDTIQWEGFREGVDDLRYVNTFRKAIEKAKADGIDTNAVETWLAGLKNADLKAMDLDTVRSEMIASILSLNTSLVLLGDVNGDGAVNALDMIRIGQVWGQTGVGGWIPEDINEDGTIDVLDATLVGQHWTG